MTDYRQLVEIMATRFGLDADWLEAQVLTESSGHADAFRYEPGIWSQLQRGVLHPAVPIDLTRAVPRRVASSYGLLQILYVTALGVGYRGEPEGLFVPETGLAFGATYMRQLLAWAKGDITAALAAYNGGAKGNGPDVAVKRCQGYVDKVTAARAAILKARTV
jgi:hypothetical protein